MAVLEERQRAQQEVSEAQQLLDVARREHAKAIVQLQQLERKVTIAIGPYYVVTWVYIVCVHVHV